MQGASKRYNIVNEEEEEEKELYIQPMQFSDRPCNNQD